jgi:hypothetical protein
VKWFVVASLFILIGVLALLRVMTRQHEQAAPPEARTIARLAVQAAAYLWVHRRRGLFQDIGSFITTLVMKARPGVIHKSILATHQSS